MRIIDSHTHLMYGSPDKLLSMAADFGYEKFNVLAIPCYDLPLNTLECLLMKKLAPGKVYVYGGMAYPDGFTPTAESHERQLELMLGAGCDGWKLLESKPSVYRELQIPLDGSVFSRAFAMAEETGTPIIWHAGDPATFWDEEKAPAFAKENNWLCIGEGFPTLEEIYRQVETVLSRHPKLKVSMAHLFFTSDDRPHAESLLAQHENFFLDLTPGSEMYGDFLADRDGWRAFFEKYQDRLVFGTDMEDYSGDVVFGSQNTILNLVLKTLAGSEIFEINGFSGTGLGMPAEVLEKILGGNFEKRNGSIPKALNPKGLFAYADWLLPKLSKELQVRAESLLAELT